MVGRAGLSSTKVMCAEAACGRLGAVINALGIRLASLHSTVVSGRQEHVTYCAQDKAARQRQCVLSGVSLLPRCSFILAR